MGQGDRSKKALKTDKTGLKKVCLKCLRTNAHSGEQRGGARALCGRTEPGRYENNWQELCIAKST